MLRLMIVPLLVLQLARKGYGFQGMVKESIQHRHPCSDSLIQWTSNDVDVVSQSNRMPATVVSTKTNAAAPDATTRRRFFKQTVDTVFVSLLSWSLSRQPSQATDVRGPVELLRPATRVRLYIARAVDLCLENQKQSGNIIAEDTPTASSVTTSLDALAYLFEHEPTSFMTMEEIKLSQRFMKIDTSSGWQSARLKEREARGAEIGVDYTTPYDKFNTAIQQWYVALCRRRE